MRSQCELKQQQAIRHLQPRTVRLENVNGCPAKDVLQFVATELPRYRWTLILADGADFGSCSLRPRIYIVGIWRSAVLGTEAEFGKEGEWTRRVQQFSGAAVQQFSSPPVQQRSSAEMQHLSSSAVQQGSTSAVEQLSQQRSSSAVQEFRISAAKQPSSKALKETLRFKGRPQD